MSMDTNSRSLTAIAALLRQRVGFDANIIGDHKIIRAVASRQQSCRIPDLDTYLQQLNTSPQELQELIEQLVVPETWFFRDRKPFDFLVEFVRTQWIFKSKGTKLRVLSVPCSTGEEPYSIAIALLEAGLSPNQFSIDAVDISHQALAKAQRAVYGKNSFRGEDWVDHSRYFQLTDGKYTLARHVCNTVKFHPANIVDGLTFTTAKYDVIFCRNLLIYLENTTCHHIFNNLYQLLTPQGLLFVGASETGKVPSNRFAYSRQAFTFAYRKLDLASAAPLSKTVKLGDRKFTPTPPPPPVSSPVPSSQWTTFPPQNITPPRNATPLASSPSTRRQSSPQPAPLIDDLQTIYHLANTGQLGTAILSCKTFLEHHTTNAEAYALLGALYQATANIEQAERCFQKALYLQPHFYEALLQLALLKESRGDAIAAARLRQRIQNLQSTA